MLIHIDLSDFLTCHFTPEKLLLSIKMASFQNVYHVSLLQNDLANNLTTSS